jgi:uncharacterized protein (DUF433 family)
MVAGGYAVERIVREYPLLSTEAVQAALTPPAAKHFNS